MAAIISVGYILSMLLILFQLILETMSNRNHELFAKLNTIAVFSMLFSVVASLIYVGINILK